MPMTRAVCTLWLAFWLVAAHARPASADGAYEQAITQALEAFERGDLDRAREAFQEAHRIAPGARTLRGLGTVDFRAGHYPAAFVNLSAALAESQRPLSPELAAAVRSLAAEVRAKVGLVEVIGAPDDVVMEVDDAPALRDPLGHIVLLAGTHVLSIRAPGHESVTVGVVPVLGGPVERVHVRLRPSSPAPEAPRAEQVRLPAPVAPLAPGPAPSRRPAGGRTWTWVAAASVPLFVAGAGAAWVRTQDIGDGIASTCRRDRCDPIEREARIDASPLATYEALTNVAWALTGVSLALTGVAYVLEGSEPETSPRLTLSPRAIQLSAGF